MTRPEPYLIVTHLPVQWRDRPARWSGRHRWNRRSACLTRRPQAVRPLPPPLRQRRGRHRRRPERPVLEAARQAGVLVALVALVVSGWFAASGATAVAQMTHP